MKKRVVAATISILMCLLAAKYSDAYIFEPFNAASSTKGFKPYADWFISDGALYYNNSEPQKYYYVWVSWGGGENPGGWDPSIDKSNYFYEFAASVIVNCAKESSDKFFGLYACGQKDSNNKTDIITFKINLDGYYIIEVIKGEKWKFYTGYIKSPAITGKNDRLTILKQGNLFRFFINYNEVEFLKFDNYLGGSVGLVSDEEAKPWFDNFEIINLAQQQPVYNLDAGTLNIPLLDVLNAGGVSGAYTTALKQNTTKPISFNLVETEVYQPFEELFSWHDILNKISISPFRPSFDFSTNKMQLPSVRQEENNGKIKLVEMNLKLQPNDNNAKLQLTSLNDYSPDCSAVDQNLWLYNRMIDVYYWYGKIPKISSPSKKYSSPELLLEAIKYKKFDKWSYITSAESFAALFEEGTYIGMGYGTKYDSNKNLRISHVYKDSPADKAGVKRGWTVLKVNGKDVEEIETNSLWDNIYGESKEGVVVNLEFADLQGNIVETQLTKKKVKINTVFNYDIFNAGDKKIGYLVFMSFLETSEQELNQVFSYFKAQKVNELVLDLRYNGGGRVSISAYLASLIAKENTNGEIFATVKYNDKHKDENYAYKFLKQSNSLNLSRIVVITGASTCSASELLINGLKPFADVITIGSITCGKPVGMASQFFCDKVLEPIMFETVNSDGKGGYFGGIEPDYEVADDFDSQFGDPNEASLKAALYYLENDKFSSAALSSHKIKSATLPIEQSVSGFRKIIGAF
ncbi:MAG: PDZ domain-containing protein [Desulfamplus sp.]|nr:PDZ domain-containing protein [Desulfamplus sp.]